MQIFSFQALGTEWSVMIDALHWSLDDERLILERVALFERRFSRFLPNSEVNAFREAVSGTHPISGEFATLLKRAEILRRLTGGRYDPAVAGLLERAGYGMASKERIEGMTEKFVLPHWSLDGDKLLLDGPTAFDLGGMGKGYCIDMVAATLKERGYEFVLVEGGGDMFGTTKADGSAWRAAIEYPGKQDTAAGVVEIRHQGLAVSDSLRRRFGRWHHIVDPQEKKTVENLVGCAAIAPTAWDADCMTSGVFLASPDWYPELGREFQAEYLAFFPDGLAQKSVGWPGEIYT